MLPDGWHHNMKAESISSYDDMLNHCKVKSVQKHVFIEFFTPGCPYCYQFMDDYNRLHDYMLDNYGSEQVGIYKINGWETPILSQAFRIPYYPFFLYIAPNTPTCSPSAYFNFEDRTYDTMLKWMLDSAGPSLVKLEKIQNSKD
jgi:thiol-disulfide isomerase/thioredoxin